MKKKNLLIFCILQLISISSFGQTHFDTYSEGNTHVIEVGGKRYVIEKPSHNVSKSWNEVGSDLGEEIGKLIGNAIVNLLRGSSNSNIYYDNKGLPYSSAKAAIAANKKYEEKQQFNQRKQVLLSNWKGEKKPILAKMERKGQRPNIVNNLELKGRPKVTLEYKNQRVISINPNSDLVYKGDKPTVISGEYWERDPLDMEDLLDALDFTLKNPPKQPLSMNLRTGSIDDFYSVDEFKKELIDIGIDVAAFYVNATAGIAASAFGTPIAGTAVKGLVNVGAVFAHATNHGQSWADEKILLDASVAATTGLVNYRLNKINKLNDLKNNYKSINIVQSTSLAYTQTLLKGGTNAEAAKKMGEAGVIYVGLLPVNETVKELSK